MSYVVSIIEKYNKLPKEIRDLVGSEERLNVILKLEKKYQIDLKFLVMLIVTKELDLADIGDYILKKYKINKRKIEELLNELIDEILMPISSYLERGELPEKVSPEEEKKLIKEMVEKKLIPFFENIKTIEYKLFNNKIIYHLFEDKSFKMSLEKALYHNKEKITAKKFSFDGKMEKPTVKNWLKDFIKTKGTGMFSRVVLNDYLTHSNNGKRLSTEEKMLVSKLLWMYRNIKFFPISFKGIPEGDWEIISVDEERRVVIPREKSMSPPKTIAEKNIEKMEEEATHYKGDSLEHLAVEEEIEHEKKIEELRFMATKFSEGSLEKKAIEEELKKMEHSK